MPDRAAQDVAALALEITGGWPQVMAVWEEFRAKHGIYLRAELDADRLSFLEQALWSAIGSGHLGALLARLAEQNLTGGGMHQAATPLLGAGFAMQSYVNGVWQPQNALINGRRLMEACDHVCRISIDGKHRGTGILIRPTIVATAAHVVAPLVGADHRCLPNSVARLSVSFFDADDLMPDGELGDATPTLGKAHEHWLAYFSPRAPGEGEALYPIDCVTGISGTGPWDLALLRLAEPPRPGLTGHRLGQGEPPAVAFGIHVLHHPADAIGAPLGLVWSIGSVKHALGGTVPLRWLHDANTDKGSSGAPCFDNNWRVVALHQAGPTAISAANQNNRAVPIYPWAQEIDDLAEEADVTPYLTFVPNERGQPQPVFGRRQLQARAWRAMTALRPGYDRALLVLGDRQSGKSFSVAILAELARQSRCRFVSLDARNVQNDSPLQFAQKILAPWVPACRSAGPRPPP